ncbi:hypothetical protein [uncultured Duncaniella sp.]|uniref:hypothetical protein n=1 Tax=uncultured Duncaniella sp. TaxID=2768039 RepID=UPI0026042ED1|nr:hypothetical protein [uncultured Duncaniella sp.]
MKRQPFCNFTLSGVSLTEFGLMIPSPFSTLELTRSEITSFTSWTLKCVVGGDDKRRVNIAAFEALLYSAAQAASSYPNAGGIPCSFVFGWLDENGNADDYLSYQGFTLKFQVQTSGQFMIYTIEGYASLMIQNALPVLRIPELSGIVQPSAVVEALAKGVKATSYYQLDIDHNDAPTLVSHGAMTTSFNQYVRGSQSAQDDYENFPGLLRLSKSYSSSRDAGGLATGVRSLSQVLNNVRTANVGRFLKRSLSDLTPQSASFSYWVDEPTMTQPGTIHYKSNAGLLASHLSDTLEYGTANTNVFSLSGSYNGVAYNMTDMKFTSVGFILDGSGNTIARDAEVVNSWSANLADVFQSVNIINDVNAIASQFSGDFTIQIPGTTSQFSVAQPVSLLVMSGNTVSPITGIYNIVSVSHTVSNTFITTLKVQRLVMSSANQVASSQGIFVAGSTNYPTSSYKTTPNIKSTGKVDFGVMYPTFEHMVTRAL